MKILYNLGIYIVVFLIKIAALFNAKAKLWVDGRKDILKQIAQRIKIGDKIIWIHAASLGEFEQGRPLIESIRSQHPEMKILLTFYSPSGYEIRKNYDAVDYVFYLPADTPALARGFVNIVRPEIAIIIKYEFWLNILEQLRESNCRTYLVSAIFRPKQVFFKWYGDIFRDALAGFKTIFVQNENSVELLKSIGVLNVEIAGDTRFDRVAAIAEEMPTNRLVESFKGQSDIFIAGSTWSADEVLIKELVNKSSGVKFIIAPHEINQERISLFASELERKVVRYTECKPGDDLSGYDVLIIDTIGILSSIYRYAKYAYIGGGFGVGIHNTLEAATFGLPMAFGPNYQRFKEARDFIELKTAVSVAQYEDLEEWLIGLMDDPKLYERQYALTKEYVRKNIGATDKIMADIFK